MEKAIKLFENKKVRVKWDSDKEKWYFSIVDVVLVLTNNDFQDARNYWKVLKHRLKEEGNQTVTNCNQLKLPAKDGSVWFSQKMIAKLFDKGRSTITKYLTAIYGSDELDENSTCRNFLIVQKEGNRNV
jgi:hypothetical protein